MFPAGKARLFRRRSAGAAGCSKRPAFAFVQLAPVAQPQIDCGMAGNGGDARGEFRAVAKQPQSPVAADESLLRCLLGQRSMAEPAPGNREHPPLVA